MSLFFSRAALRSPRMEAWMSATDFAPFPPLPFPPPWLLPPQPPLPPRAANVSAAAVRRNAKNFLLRIILASSEVLIRMVNTHTQNFTEAA